MHIINAVQYTTITAGIAAFANSIKYNALNCEWLIIFFYTLRVQFKASCKYLYRCMKERKERGEGYHDQKLKKSNTVPLSSVFILNHNSSAEKMCFLIHRTNPIQQIISKINFKAILWTLLCTVSVLGNAALLEREFF